MVPLAQTGISAPIIAPRFIPKTVHRSAADSAPQATLIRLRKLKLLITALRLTNATLVAAYRMELVHFPFMLVPLALNVSQGFIGFNTT
jgi:hypothetical protein